MNIFGGVFNVSLSEVLSLSEAPNLNDLTLNCIKAVAFKETGDLAQAKELYDQVSNKSFEYIYEEVALTDSHKTLYKVREIYSKFSANFESDEFNEAVLDYVNQSYEYAAIPIENAIEEMDSNDFEIFSHLSYVSGEYPVNSLFFPLLKSSISPKSFIETISESTKSGDGFQNFIYALGLNPTVDIHSYLDLFYEKNQLNEYADAFIITPFSRADLYWLGAARPDADLTLTSEICASIASDGDWKKFKLEPAIILEDLDEMMPGEDLNQVNIEELFPD